MSEKLRHVLSEGPCVLLDAEHTCWPRNATAIALMGIRFLVERFGLFMRMVCQQALHLSQRCLSLGSGGGLRPMPATLRSSDTVARLGSDEFAILLSPAGTQSEAADVLQHVQFAVSEPVDLESGGQVQVGASIGLAWDPQDSDDPSVLLSLADERMFEAKRAGRAASSRRPVGDISERVRHE